MTFILSIGIELGSSLSSPLVHKTEVKIITLSPPQFEVNLLSVTNIKHGICWGKKEREREAIKSGVKEVKQSDC